MRRGCPRHNKKSYSGVTVLNEVYQSATISSRVAASVIDGFFHLLLDLAILSALTQGEWARVLFWSGEDWLWFAFSHWMLGLVYYALFESSSWRATPGKRMMGVLVCDWQGGRLSPQRAVMRYGVSLLSGLVFYGGYFMALFTNRSLCLHDWLTHAVCWERPISTRPQKPQL